MKTKILLFSLVICVSYGTVWAQRTSYGNIIGADGNPGTAGQNGDITNSYFGHQAGNDNTGNDNTFIGRRSGFLNSTGSDNTFVGEESGQNNNGNNNTFIGEASGHNNTTGNNNTFLGGGSGFNNIDSDDNTFVGYRSGYHNTNGDFNLFLGHSSGFNNTIGDDNTILGYRSGYNNQTGSANVFLGYNAGYNETGSNLLYIDNSSTSSPLIWGDFSTDVLRINGTLNINNVYSFPIADGSDGQVLSTDGSGILSWAAAAVDTNTQLSEAEVDAYVSNNGYLSAEVDGSTTNELQDLNITANQLTLSNDPTPVDIDLSVYLDNTDAQTLDLVGNTLSIAGGNSVDLSSLSDGTGTDDQQISLMGNQLQLEDGGNVDLAVYLDNTDDQNLTFNEGPRRLSISNGNSVNLSSLADNLGDHLVMQDLLPVFGNALNIGSFGAAFNNIHFNGALYVNDQPFLHAPNNNLALGANALSMITTGTQNVALGENALDNNQDGNNNVAIGYDAGISDLAFGTVSNSIAIGHGAVVTASNQVRLGNFEVEDMGGAAAWTVISDGRFKINVKEDVAGLDFIKTLRPVSYNLDRRKIRAFTGNTNATNSDVSKKIIGFIAQEVEQAVSANNYVFTGVKTPVNEKDHYGLKYAEFVVPLVKGMQEQQDMIQAQQALIETLQQEIETLKNSVYGSGATNGNTQTKIPDGFEGFMLYQNTPNPFDKTTSISAMVPEHVQQAKIVIYNLNGLELEGYPVNERGSISVDISGGRFPSGMYLYALIADGRVIDTKKMILTR